MCSAVQKQHVTVEVARPIVGYAAAIALCEQTHNTIGTGICPNRNLVA